MKLFVFTAVLSIATSIFCVAQTLPSPSSQGIIGSQNSNGGLFSGSTSIGIPLFSAVANNGAGVPVSISYGTSGIKVGQVATPVGLGWNLNAGGTITRIIRGIPDEYAGMVNDPASLDYTKLDEVMKGIADSEKDLFYVSFPGGGGRFIFEGDFNDYFTETVWCHPTASDLQACQTACNGDGNCIADCQNYNMSRLDCETTVTWDHFQTLPYSDIDIKYHFDGYTDGYWEITDMRGVKYTFSSTETTVSNSTEPDGSIYDPNDAYDYVSSWHLTSIVYPDLPVNEGITFSYSTPVNLTQERENRKTFATAPLGGGTLTVENTEIVRSKTETGVRYLEGIHFSKGDISFTYTNERDDLPGAKRLTSVALKDKQGNTVSTYSFVQNYFSARYSYYQGSTNPAASRPEDHRLKLETVYKDGGFVQSFIYRNELNYVPGSGINYYELPPRDSYYFDHWGYNNAGVQPGTTFVPYPEISGNTEERPTATFTLTGMDRESSSYAQANILSKVIFPTGGYSLYTYANHVSGGGVRLDKVETFDETATRVAGTSFTYENPVAYTNPIYHRTEELNYDLNGFPSLRDRLAIYEQSLSNVLDLNGTSIGYGKVTVTDLMRGGKTEHFFKNDLRLAQVEPDKHNYTIADIGTLTSNGAISNPNLAPFSTNSLLYYDRGSYDSMRVYGEEDSVNPILIRKYNYENINSTPYYTVPSLAVEIKKDYGSYQDVLTSQYNMQVKTYRLQSTTQTSYENGGEVSKSTYISYLNTSFPTLTTHVETINSRGYNSKAFYTYPGDVSTSTRHHVGTLQTMTSKGMHGVMVQSESQVNFSGNYETTGVSITRFKEEHSLIVPHIQYSLLETPVSSWSESDLVKVNENIDYSTSGLLLSRKGFDNVTVNMEYDANGFLEKTIVNPGTTYERTTIYENKDLVGITKVTDANGRKVSYEYDDRNRLLLTRNNEDNITARYRYHAVNDNHALNAAINTQWHIDGNYEDRVHQFSLTNINCPYGECTYTWNWGDGTANSTGTSVSHTYTSGGSYQIKVTISNPEYNEPVEVTANVSIQTANYWTLSMNGPTEHCIYDSNAPQSFGAVIGAGVSTCSPGGQYTYAWSYQYNSTGSWVPFGSGQSYESWPQNTNVTGNHKVRVVVTDQCGRSLTATRDFDLIDSGNNCSSGGGGNPPE